MKTAGVRLRTASRIKLRSTRPPAAAARAAISFSERVFARYLRRGALSRTLELLLSMRSPLFVQHILQRCGIEVTAPSFVLRERQRNPRQPFMPARETQRRPSVAAASRRWSRQANERAAATSTLLHLVQRTVRLEAAPPGSATNTQLSSPGSATGGPGGDGGGTLPVVRRPVDSQAVRKLLEQNDTRAREKAAQSSHGDPHEWAASGTQPRRTGVEVDIEQLADRVIGSIDRRIVAQRERLGRN